MTSSDLHAFLLHYDAPRGVYSVHPPTGRDVHYSINSAGDLHHIRREEPGQLAADVRADLRHQLDADDVVLTLITPSSASLPFSRPVSPRVFAQRLSARRGQVPPR